MLHKPGVNSSQSKLLTLKQVRNSTSSEAPKEFLKKKNNTEGLASENMPPQPA